MKGATPSAARLVRAVRRKSWKRQLDSSVARTSIVVLYRSKLRMPLRPPVVENTKSPPAKRGSDLSRSTAMPESGTSCAAPLLVRLAGTIQSASSRSTSPQVIWAASLRRTAVRSRRRGRADAFSALPEQCKLRVGKHALARGHGADELARLDKLAGIALDVAELARDAEAIDAGRERERLGRHVGAGLPVDFLEHGDGVGALDLGGNASAPARDKMSLDGLFDLGCGALLGGSGTAQKCLGERTEGVDRVPALLRMHAGHEIAERRAGELARRRQADAGLAAEHHADRARVAPHAAHDEKGDHAAIGDSTAERGLC